MGLVVASSLQDVGLAYSEAPSLPSVPELPRFHHSSGIQYGSFSGSSHSGLQVNESDNDVVWIVRTLSSSITTLPLIPLKSTTQLGSSFILFVMV